jgi:hypothetical protein
MLTKEEALAFEARWRLVNDTIIEEIRNTPLETKLLQLGALVASVYALGWDEKLRQGEADVRERWLVLKRMSNA